MTRHRSGFTLLEVSIVVVVASIMILAVFSTLSSTRKTRATADELDRAREAARAKLEFIASLPMASLPGLHNTTFAVPDPADLQGAAPATPDFNARWRPLTSSVTGQQPGIILVDSATPPAEAGALVRVTVRVRWLVQDGRANVVEYTTLVAEQG